jgi:hypothetical protein
MKIAVPTDDGVRISASSMNPGGYLVFTLSGGEIINEELRWNNTANHPPADLTGIDCLSDCSVIIANISSSDLTGFEPSDKIRIIQTGESIITNVIMEYLDVTLLRESNTCCSP